MPPLPLHVIPAKNVVGWLGKQPEHVQNWCHAHGLEKASSGTITAVPDVDGRVLLAVAVSDDEPSLWTLGDGSSSLPAGSYQLQKDRWKKEDLKKLLLGWQLGSYRFSRYRHVPEPPAMILSPEGMEEDAVMVDAIFLARDLINTPPMDMMPRQLAETTKHLAKKHQASCKELVGGALLKEGFEAIHTVGRASAEAPRLLDVIWGDESHPKVTLVGKGVCFDTGGLDIKPSSAMKLMKKDMGGAAIALAVADMVMAWKLPIRLRVLIPAVENAVGGNAYRTSDVIRTRKGLTVEVGNTDAEGRLILCDALAEADREAPDVLMDIATLTGAARVALGTELPALFASVPALGQEIADYAKNMEDPMWLMPLWQDYARQLKSTVADLHSTGDDSYGGAILAALFLQRFVEHAKLWLHMDVMAWNQTPRPGRPKGGEAMGARAIALWLKQRYGEKKR